MRPGLRLLVRPISVSLGVSIAFLCSLTLSQFSRADDAQTATSGKPPAEASKNKDNDPDDGPKSVSKRRLEIMQAAIDSFRTEPLDLKDESQVKPGTKPLLRYDDQVRNLLDAGVWRIGETGRPTAYITMELYGAGMDQALLTYEFISLSPQKFAMTSLNGPVWRPATTELKIVDLPESVATPDSEPGRLTKMRETARKFHAVQTYRGQKIELRLLTQPIDRYSHKDRQIVDGAVFVFANGTNPEMGLLLETDGKKWNYGLFRMSTAPIAVQYNGKEVEGIPPNPAYGVERAYTATRHGVNLPK